MSNTRKMMSGFLAITSLAMVVLLALVNCGGGGSGGGNSSAPAAEPSAQDKIAVALTAGTIDYGTSLLYRAYAFYGDARLPAEYLGSGSNEEDNGLRFEILTAGTSSAGLQAALEPFTVRPEDPKSWFNQVSAAAGKPQSGKSGKASTTSGAVQSSVAVASGGKWVSEVSTAGPVRVWAQTNGDAAYDAASMQAIADTLTIIDMIWVPMTALMGEPVYDMDGDIDIYIVDWLSSVHRRGEDRIPKGFAVAFNDYPAVGKTTSAFILIPQSTVVSQRFHTTVIHELFHVLQKAHNNDISNSWFTEASARWASVYYDRELGPWKNGRAAYVEAHHAFTERFQKSKESLNSSAPGPQIYDAYIWAYFLEQETGSPAIIGKIWTALESANNIAEADIALDSLYPFKDNFRIFAVRNLNTEFQPGDPLPITQRYVSLDPAEFKNDKVEPTYGGGPLIGDSELPYSTTLEPLFADYLKFTVSDPAVKQVLFDLSGLAAEPGLDVDVLIKTKGKDWEKRDLNGQTELKFCVDKDGEALDDIRFILSNHKYGPGESVLATFTARSYTTPCPGTWSGPFSYTDAFLDASDGGTLTIVWSGTATWGHPVVASSWSTDYSLDSIVATVTVDGVTGIGAYDCTYHGSKAVTLSDFTPSQDVMWLTVNGSYFASLGAATTLTLTYTCPDPSNNSVQPDYPVGLPWWTATSDGSFYSLDVDKHMKGSYVADASPFIETYTWDFVYAVQ